VEQKLVEFDGFIFSVIRSSEGVPQVYQDAKGYFGARWISVDVVPPGKELLIEKINEVFHTKFFLKDGRIYHD